MMDPALAPSVPPPATVNSTTGTGCTSTGDAPPSIPKTEDCVSNATVALESCHILADDECDEGEMEGDSSDEDAVSVFAAQTLQQLLSSLKELLPQLRVVEHITDEHWQMLEQFQEALSSDDSEPDAEMLRFMGTFLLRLGAVEVAASFFAAAVQLYPRDCDSAVVCGNFMDQVLHQPERAEEMYRKCLSVEPTHPDASQNLGAVLIERAKVPGTTPSQMRALFAEARAVLTKADGAIPGFTAYNLACVAALEKDAAECERWLRHAAKHGTLPSPATLQSDPDLTFASSQAWFAAIVSQAQMLESQAAEQMS